MKALVLWADKQSSNLGVQVLAAGAASLLREAIPNIDVDFQSFGPGPAPASITLKSIGGATVARRHALREWMSTYNVVMDMGAGDSFTDIYGLRRMTEMAALSRLAVSSGIPLVLGPQTIGPFNSRLGTKVARYKMHSAQLILARDSVSYRVASDLAPDKTHLASDVVFQLERSSKQRRGSEIYLNISGLLWRDNPHFPAHMYRALMTKLVADLISHGHNVRLFAHVLDSDLADNDIPACRELAAQFSPELSVVVPKSLIDARDSLAGCQMLIGARMHACLNAISQGTPSVAISYSRKFSGLFSDLNYPYFIDLQETLTTAAIMEKVHASQSYGALVSDAPRRLLLDASVLIRGVL